MRWFIMVCALVACVLSGAALAVSLTHAGPAGPTGPQGVRGPAGQQGNAGRAAQTARLGVCWSYTTQTSSDGSVTWVNSETLSSPVLSNGVYTCGQGEQFVSIVPGP